MFALRIVFVLIISIFVFSCAQEPLADQVPTQVKETKGHAPQSNLVNIQIDQSQQFDNLSLEFMQIVGDSRCPKGVQCAWKGNLQLVLLATDSKAAETLTLNTHGGSKYPNVVQHKGYDIKLLKVAPYPATNIRIDPSQFVAQFEIKPSEQLIGPVYIDVRTAEEFNAGHYPNAVNLEYETIDQTIDSLGLDKTTEIIVYCRSGRRSGIAQSVLADLGYSNVTNGINQDTLHKKNNSAPTM